MIRRIILLSICLGIFLTNASAQENPFPNEIDGLQFTKQATFRSLKFLISTKEDIASVVGHNCAAVCKYDDNWDIEFAFVDKGTKGTKTSNAIRTIYKVRAEYLGKLLSVRFTPRTPHILPESLVFPKDLQCSRPGDSKSLDTQKFKACWDDRVIAYHMYSEDDSQGKYRKNEIVDIFYGISNQNLEDILSTEPEPAEPKN
jgi:hypothetical protein